MNLSMRNDSNQFKSSQTSDGWCPIATALTTINQCPKHLEMLVRLVAHLTQQVNDVKC